MKESRKNKLVKIKPLIDLKNQNNESKSGLGGNRYITSFYNSLRAVVRISWYNSISRDNNNSSGRDNNSSSGSTVTDSTTIRRILVIITQIYQRSHLCQYPSNTGENKKQGSQHQKYGVSRDKLQSGTPRGDPTQYLLTTNIFISTTPLGKQL
ncbi:hypothetical protein ACTA71_002168 [Dictyostelium dimigraforme]